ncbi:MAG: tetratricopeptide repeat protein [Candidatus Magasanikbacteria bacterium]
MTKITNPNREERIKEFHGHRSDYMDEYFDLVETEMTWEKFIEEMRRLIEKDDKFFDPYLDLAEALKARNKEDEARKILKEGYEKAMKMIVDKEGRWPERMEWVVLSNRHIMRMIRGWAYQLWEEQKEDEALGILRKLFRANPNDNQGCRYDILAIRMGLGTDWDEPFVVEEGPMAGEALKAGELSEWFEENKNDYPDEFEWWEEEMERREKETQEAIDELNES